MAKAGSAPDIDPGDTLQYRSARENDDERHICPTSTDVIRRCLRLWTSPNDVVLSPFGGIGSGGRRRGQDRRRAVLVRLRVPRAGRGVEPRERRQQDRNNRRSSLNPPGRRMKFCIAKRIVRSFSVAEARSEKPPRPSSQTAQIVARMAVAFGGTDTMIGARSSRRCANRPTGALSPPRSSLPPHGRCRMAT